MRYVADAPFRSLRYDLGLTPQGTPIMPFASTSSASHAALQARVHTLESVLQRLEASVAEQAREMASMAVEAVSDAAPSYVRHTVTATVHRVRPTDDSRTICGICLSGPTFRARRRDCSRSFLPLDSLEHIPGLMMCERCLPNEKVIAVNRDLIDAEISGDELEG